MLYCPSLQSTVEGWKKKNHTLKSIKHSADPPPPLLITSARLKLTAGQCLPQETLAAGQSTRCAKLVCVYVCAPVCMSTHEPTHRLRSVLGKHYLSLKAAALAHSLSSQPVTEILKPEEILPEVRRR